MPVAAELAIAGDTATLRGNLGLTNVAALAARAGELVTGRSAVTVDLAGVERADSAALALLLEWRRAADRAGCALAFSNVPEGLGAIADASGVDELLGLRRSAA